MTVYVPSEISSGFNEFDLALLERSLTANASPFKFRWSAFLITGTIKFPFSTAVAIPIFIALLITILPLTTELFKIGNSFKDFTIALINIGVNVNFCPSFS